MLSTHARRLVAPGRGARAILALAALIAACSGRREDSGAPPSPGEWRVFRGTWSAAGERRTLESGPGQVASVVDLSGTILLTGERGLGVGFHGRAIAFSDGTENGVGRAVWTDERGDRIYSEVHGAPVATGRRIVGTFTGGTGRWSGLTGDYRFDWAWVVEAGEGEVQGRAVGLEGRARLGAPAEGRR